MWRLKKNNKIMCNTKYKQLCKQCKTAIKNNKINKMKHLCNAKNCKSFCNHTNKKLDRTPLLIFLTDANKNKIDENTVVELFDSYFYSTNFYDNGKLPTFKKHYKNVDDYVAFDSSKIIKY